MKNKYEVLNIDNSISNYKKSIAVSAIVSAIVGIFSVSHAIASLKNFGEGNYVKTISNGLVALFDYGLFIFETNQLDKDCDKLRLLKERKKDE